MRYIHIVILTFLVFGLHAQQPRTATGRIELGDGKYVIESFTITMVGDSIQLEMGDLKIMGEDGPTVMRFAVPPVFAVPVTKSKLRRRVDPSDYAGQLRATVVDLSEREDELVMELEISLDGDVINRRLSYLIIPELIAGDSTATGAGLLVNGWGKDDLYRRKLKFANTALLENMPDIKVASVGQGDTFIRYSLRLPYQPWMDEARLDIHQVVGSPADKEQLYTLAGAATVKLQPREPYIVQPKVNMIVPDREQKSRRMQGQAFLDFAVGRSVIVPTFRRNPEELAKIQSAIRAVQNDRDVEIVGLFIEGYASPDGSYATNERLARERSQALSNYISQNYGIPASMIRTSSVAEDWDGLRVLVEESDLVRKEEVLAVIDSELAPDTKEQRLRAMGWPWTAMNNSMFPQLRRVEYQIDFTVKDYSVEESRSLATRNPEMLSQRELYLLAQTLEYGSGEWEQIFETIIRLYPDNRTALLNYSAILLERGELSAAKRMLDRLGEDPDAANNLGVYYLLTGDTDRAGELLRRAAGAGVSEASHNLEELARKVENNALMERYRR